MRAVKYGVGFLATVAVLVFIYLKNPAISNIVTFTPTTNEQQQQRIPLFISSDNNQNNSLQANSTCKEKHRNFVFVKTHKTGTSTTVNILYHFGIIHGLNYAIYPYSHQLHLVKPERLMRLQPNESYNIMCQHMVFDRSAVESVMPTDSYYFSLIRSPIKAFISFFIFYHFDDRQKQYAGKSISLDESINSFLDAKYRDMGIRETPGICLISNSLNSMSFDLGMSQGSTTKITDDDIKNYIRMLDDRFRLMMILEHLDESLLLLKQDLCWDTHELYYLNRMKSKSNRSHEAISETTIARLKEALTPDVLLYNHFSTKLNKRLEKMPPEFQEELKKFKESEKKFEEKCMVMDRLVPAPFHSQQHPLTEHGKHSLHCQILADRDIALTKFVSRLQDPNYVSRPKVESYGYLDRYRTLETFPRQWKLNT